MKRWIVLTLMVLFAGGSLFAEDGGWESASSDGSSSDSSATTQTAGSGDFQMGFGVSSVNVDGKSWTRLNLFPVIPVWKFKFAFDVEVFLDGDGNLSSKGWDFSTLDSGIDSVQRKLYYISYGNKSDVVGGKDVFYAKVGALDSVTLGRGIIMQNFNNTLSYPLDKKLGLEFSLGNISPIKIGVEGMLNNFADLSRGGVVFGGRLFFSPLAPTGVPVLDKLQFGVTYAADVNQYAGLKDSDGDGYPDVTDKFPNDAKYHADTDNDGTPDAQDVDLDGDNLVDYTDLAYTNKQALTNYLASLGITNNTIDFSVTPESVFSVSNKTDMFSMFGVDAVIPVTSFLTFYAQWAMNIDITNQYDMVQANGWGLSGPGVELNFLPIVKVNLEYRRVNGAFKFGYFGQQYDTERAFLAGSTVLTKDNTLISNTVNGVFGSMTVNLFLLYGYASYEFLMPEGNGLQTHNLEGRLFLNRKVLKSIPQVDKLLGDFEAYYIRKNATNIVDVLPPNPDIQMGLKVGLKLGGTTQLTYDVKVVYSPTATKATDAEVITTISTETVF